MVGACPLPSPSGKFRIRHCIQWDCECDSAKIQKNLTHYEQLFRGRHTQSLLLLPTAREGNVFTGVCLSTIGLMDTGSLPGLVTVRSYWNTFLYNLVFFIHVREICQQQQQQHQTFYFLSPFFRFYFLPQRLCWQDAARRWHYQHVKYFKSRVAAEMNDEDKLILAAGNFRHFSFYSNR